MKAPDGDGLVEILSLTALETQAWAAFVSQATQIFFETASIKTFASQAEQDAFYQRWFGHYLDADPACFLLAVEGKGAAIGYLAGCLDSFAEAARTIIDDISIYTPAFCSALRGYPSHFHINVKPGFQGQGVGRCLLTRFVDLCRNHDSPGIHVVTGAQSRAVAFYRACGFTPISVPDAGSGAAVLICAIPQATD